ncbi:hypothetical protein Hanom_Chr09g00808151 [Helianthus anomalus]
MPGATFPTKHPLPCSSTTGTPHPPFRLRNGPPPQSGGGERWLKIEAEEKETERERPEEMKNRRSKARTAGWFVYTVVRRVYPADSRQR